MNEWEKYKQIKLWDEEESIDVKEDNALTNNLSNKVPILFRNAVSEIPSTTYGTFAIYKYPAKFIPQIGRAHV